MSKPSGPRRLRLDIEYLGTHYHGWQWQANARSIQQVVEEALASVLTFSGRLQAGGRTDTGVHARGQVAHFDTLSAISADRLRQAVNSFLPWDIRVRAAIEVGSSFHARFSAHAKTYRYEILHSPTISPFEFLTVERVGGRLDREAMTAAAPLFAGRHDFAGFAAPTGAAGGGGVKRDTQRTIHAARLEWDGPRGTFTVRGEGFLRGMVRRQMGALLAIGWGKADAKALARELAGEPCGEEGERSSKTPRPIGSYRAAARGLTLWEIEYPDAPGVSEDRGRLQQGSDLP